MPIEPFPPRWHEVVHRPFARTAGYVVAQNGACLEVQTKKTTSPTGRVPGRDFQAIRPVDLPGLRFPASWFMAILLCPDDEPSLYHEWFRRLNAKDRDRVVFLYHPDLAQDTSDTPWQRAHLPTPRTQRFQGTWEKFHPLFGRRHADRVYEDHPPTPDP